jgi:hypothetical protein
MTLRVADELPQHGLFEDGGIAVGARLHEALALHPGGHGIGDVVGCSVEVSDGRQQGRGVPGRLEEAGNDGADVRLEQLRPLVQRQPVLLVPPHPRGLETAPLGVHRVRRPGRGDQVRDRPFPPADPAPGPDVVLARRLLRRLDPARLGLMPASGSRQGAGGEAGVKADAAKPLG